MRENDFFLSINIIDFKVEQYSCSGLYKSEENKSKTTISIHKPLIEDDYFHGLELSFNADSFSIKNDFFCTVPVYYAIVDTTLIISSNPKRVISEVPNAEIDEAGFWESMLFSNCVYDRTPIKSLKQLPPMHEILLDTKGLSVSKFYNMNFSQCDESEVESVIEQIHLRLTDIFSKFDESEHLIGVSGGLDSRLSLGYLNNLKEITPFTFYASENSLELSLAEKLCKELGFSTPNKFLLTPKDYNTYTEILGELTAGQVGFHHSHIMHCLSEANKKSEFKQISNYFTDAVFGWAVNTESDNNQDSWSAKVESISSIPNNVKSSILEDIGKVFEDYSLEQNFSCKDEYKYIFERNQKFHMNLAFQQNRICDTFLPYCDYKLMNLVFSLPLSIRKNKKISEILISKCGISDMETISSRQMISGQGFSQKYGIMKSVDNFVFKITNALTLITSRITNGTVVFPNKYQCEAHYNIFHMMKSSGLFDKDLLFLSRVGVLSAEEIKFINNTSLRNGGVSSYFQLHTLTKYLKLNT